MPPPGRGLKRWKHPVEADCPELARGHSIIRVKMSSDGRSTAVPGISSRRSACDRCRVQKARCLREQADQARCDRCVRADAECVTSPICRRRSWQIIAYDSSNSSTIVGSKKRQRRGQQDQEVRTPGESTGAFGMQFANRSHSTSPFYSDQSAALPASSSILPQPLPESSAQLAAGNVAGFEALFSQPTDLSLNYIQDSLGLSDEFFMTGALAPAQNALQVSPVPSSDNPDLMGTTSPLNVTGPSSIPNDPTPESRGEGTTDSRDNGNTPQQDVGSPLQQLSRLDYELVTLLTFLDKGRPHVTIDTLISPIDNAKSSKPAVDDILNRTREFVDLLKAFSGHQPSSAATKGPQSSPKRRSHPPDASRGSSDMDHDTPSDSFAQSMASTLSSSSSSPTMSDSRATTALDSTSLLTILTVYIRVLRLHLVIFSNVYELLKDISKSDNPVLCPVPGLNFSSFHYNLAIYRQPFSSRLSPVFLGAWRHCWASRASFASEAGNRKLPAYLGNKAS